MILPGLAIGSSLMRTCHWSMRYESGAASHDGTRPCQTTISAGRLTRRGPPGSVQPSEFHDHRSSSELYRGAGSVRGRISKVGWVDVGSDPAQTPAELPGVVDRDDPGQCRVPREERGERVVAHGHPGPVQVAGEMQDVL